MRTFIKYQCHFISTLGIKIDHFTEEMTKKMLVKDEDEEIRQTFLSFDSQCKYKAIDKKCE